MDNEFGFKELYDVRLKSTQTLEIGKNKFEPNETIVLFDRIQLANFSEFRNFVSANGGFHNQSRVIWEEQKEIDLNFMQGIFSKKQFALMANAKMVELDQENLIIDQTEFLETDQNGKIELKYLPVEKLYCYDENRNRIVPISFSEKELFFKEKFKNIVVEYSFVYENKSQKLLIGENLSNGFLSLEGKTRVKDDITGKVKTGIIRIPKLKIISKLSLSLGENASPQIGNFSAIGYPTGMKGNNRAMEFILLEDDIDADIR